MSTETDTKPKMRRSLRILLIASLTLNFLVVGVVVGGAVAHWHSPDDRPRNFDFSSPYVRALEIGDRRSIGKAIRGHHRQRGAGRGVLVAQYREVAALLRQSPLDVPALEALLEQQRRANSERQQAAQRIWLEHLQEMSDEDRAAYADRLETGLRRKGRGPRGNH